MSFYELKELTKGNGFSIGVGGKENLRTCFHREPLTFSNISIISIGKKKTFKSNLKQK